MSIKNMGHYEGIVEDPTNEEIEQMDIIHKTLYHNYKRKERLEQELENVNKIIDKIKNDIKEKIEKGKKFNWTWIYYITKGRVSWKEEFVKALGTKKAEEISEQAKKKKHPQIGIKFIDPIPDTIKQIKENKSNIPTIKHKLK